MLLRGVRDAECAVGPERHGRESGVESAAGIVGVPRLRLDALVPTAAERVAVSRRRGGNGRGVVQAPVVVVLLLDAIAGAAVRRGVHGRHVMRREREAEPAAGRRVAPTGAAAAVVAGHFVGRPAGRSSGGGWEKRR
jgi:hypothetical protein